MKTFLRKSGIFAIVFVMTNLFFSNAAFGQEPSITLDQADLDYAPGETVYITGSGWKPGETVTLEVSNLTNPDVDCGPVSPEPHVLWTIVADGAGNFNASWYVNDCELGAQLFLEAYGRESGFTFEIFFTDAESYTPSWTESTNTISVVTSALNINKCYRFILSTPSNSVYATSSSHSGSAGAYTENFILTSPYSVGTWKVQPQVQNSCTGIFVNDGVAKNVIIGCTTPSITSQPSNQTVTYGGNASFAIVASGTALLAFQWQVNTNSGGSWSNIGGATSSTLSLVAPTVAMSGNLYHCIVTNSCGTVTSNNVLLTIDKLNINGTFIVSDKIYDGNNTATVTDRTLVGALLDDIANVSLTGGTATFSDANAVNGKTVTLIGATLTGSASGNYNLTSVSNTTANITKATTVTTVSITGAPFTYTGSAQTPASVTVIGANLSLTPAPDYANNTNAGTATASYTYAGDDNHTGSNDSEDFEIGKASTVTTVSITGAPFTYTGWAQTPVSVTVIGANLSLTPAPDYANNTNAGTATASYTYAGDANHQGSLDSENFAIGKASSTTVVTINGGPFTYTGSAQTPATVSITGAGGLNETLAADYANNTNAGTATASYTYAGDDNHTGSNDSEDFEIGKASTVTTVSITGAPFTYTGSAQTPATVSVTGAGGLNETLASDYANNTNAGTATASYIYAGDDNHTGSNDSEDFEIGKASTVTTVSITGAPFTYTGSAQTPATVSVTGAGGLNETLAADYANNTNAGTATASYIYAGDDNHTGSNDSEDFEIGKASTVTTVSITGAPFTYTGSAQTPASVSVIGANLSLTPAPDYANNTNAGTATASYTYAGDANHQGSLDSEIFLINKANTVVTVNGYTGTYDASAHGATGSLAGVAGDPTVAGSTLDLGASFTNVPGGTANWTFTGGINYNDQSGSVAIVINKANAVVTVNGYTGTYDASAHGATLGSATGVSGVNLASSVTIAPTTYTNYPGGSVAWSFANSNYVSQSGIVNIDISKADALVNVTGNTGVYDAIAHGVAGTVVGVVGDLGATGSTLNLGATYTNVPGGTANWTFTGGTNYLDKSGTATIVITKAPSTTVVTVSNSTYDGNQHGGTAVVTGVGELNQSLVITYSGIAPTVYAASINAPTLAGYYNSVASYSGDANHNSSSENKKYYITQAPTDLTLTLSGYQVRYMDNLTYTAVIKPLNTATPLTGSVVFKVMQSSTVITSYTANVVPIPGAIDGSVQAMVIIQLPATVIPDSYTITAIFTSANPNYASGSTDSKTLIVISRDATPYAATGFYVGDGFVWTTGPSTSTATVTMVVAIKDTNVPGGDVRGAKVSFYFVNGTTLTAIPSAQNLPVGLVDVTDGRLGTASTIVQLNIGSLNSQSFQIAVKITGAYTSNPWDALSGTIVTVSKPVTGGFITGGSNLTNQNSSGYIKGATGLNTDFQFDIQYTKSGTNPKGKVNIMVRSWYDSKGILDSKLHTYLIRTNAIALLAIANPLATGTFSAKANMDEQLIDGTVVSVESGATFQMVAFQNACDQKIAITYYRKAGGVWFASNWDAATAKSVLQAVNSKSQVFVSGGGNCSVSAPLISARTKAPVIFEQVKALAVIEEPVPFNIIAYPNPAKYQFTLVIEGGSKEKVGIMVYDVLGRTVKRIESNDDQPIIFGEELPKGAYFTIISKGSNQKTLLLIKE
jgi:hypothetical protein